MDIVKYDDKDVLPVVMAVLGLSINHFVLGLFNVALDKEYKDLKGLVNPDLLDEGVIELVDALDDPLSLLVVDCVDDIQQCNYSLANLHGLELEEVFDREEIITMAEYFFWSIAVCPEEGDYINGIFNLDILAYSLSFLIYWLCQLLIVDEVDLDIAGEVDLFCCTPLGDMFLELMNNDRYEVRILAELGNKMEEYYFRIADFEEYS